MNLKYCRNKRDARGLSLLEISLAMALAALLMASITVYGIKAARIIKLRNDAQTFSLVMQAAESYIAANRAMLSAAGSNVTVSLADLKTADFLANSVEERLSNQQQMVLLVRPLAATDDIEALLVSFDGAIYGDSDAVRLASMAGGNAGFVLGTNVQGVNRRWTSALSNWRGFGVHRPSLGHLAALVSPQASSGTDSPWLSRVLDVSKPQLNRMQTTLELNNDAVRGASCNASRQLSGDGNQMLICKELRTGGFQWATLSDINRFNQMFNEVIFTRSKGTNEFERAAVDYDRYITLRANGSVHSVPVIGDHYGCEASISLYNGSTWYRVSSNMNDVTLGRNRDKFSCEAATYVPKNWKIKFRINANWNGYRGDAEWFSWYSKFK